MFFPIRILIVLLLLAAVIALEVFLSRRKAWWPGLVLPVLLFLYSIVAIISSIEMCIRDR